MSKLLRKNIYLLGVGYYGSTNKIGKISAYMAAKAAKHIVTRDQESCEGFSKYTKHVSLDNDIAFLIPQIDLATYQPESTAIAKSLTIHSDMIYVSIRRFEDKRAQQYHEALERCFTEHPKQHFVISLLQPAAEYQAGHQMIREWAEKYENVQHLDPANNPLALFYFFQTYATNFRFITPQFHAIITAMLCNIPFFPVAYDNKVTELLRGQERKSIPFMKVTYEMLSGFLNEKQPQQA